MKKIIKKIESKKPEMKKEKKVETKRKGSSDTDKISEQKKMMRDWIMGKKVL